MNSKASCVIQGIASRADTARLGIPRTCEFTQETRAAVETALVRLRQSDQAASAKQATVTPKPNALGVSNHHHTKPIVIPAP
jgi:hypothetical protein